MSDVQNTTAAAETHAVDQTITQSTEPTTTEAPKVEAATEDTVAAPAETETAATTTDDIAAADKKDETAAAPVTEKAEEKKPVEPITEGQLAVKGPGLLKSIIPSKKEFWLSDDAVAPQDLNSYMRGEKPEIAHPVVAWASQTGKGLLFFNKKGDTARKQPGHVLALYDATDLKKEAPHEVAFKLHGQEHVLKATSDAERDGWFVSIEKAIEIGKAQKEEVRGSEGYKAEMEKLNKPAVTAAAVAAASAAKRSQSQPKKETEADKTEAAAARKNSDLEEDDKKDKKPRSTSRGVLGRLKSKKDEAETKKEEKKEEKKADEEAKPEEHSKAEEAAVPAAVVAGTAAGAAAVGIATSEDKKEETVESPAETKTEDKSKPAKRGSIFGKMQGWGAVKSPSKEKEQKDAELKPDVPPKDDVAVAETAPQLPETATTTTTTEPVEDTPKTTDAEAAATEEKKDISTPGKEKSNFLSGLSFMGKRNRSVSPSTNMKDAPAAAKAEETPAAAEVPKEAEPVEEGKTDEAIAETTAVEPLKPEDPAAAKTTDTTANKRQSVLGNLGRRASKAFKGIQAPKKENAAPVTTDAAKKEETTADVAKTEEPTTNGESKPVDTQPQQQIGDVVPEAINVGRPENQPAAVAASA